MQRKKAKREKLFEEQAAAAAQACRLVECVVKVRKQHVTFRVWPSHDRVHACEQMLEAKLRRGGRGINGSWCLERIQAAGYAPAFGGDQPTRPGARGRAGGSRGHHVRLSYPVHQR